MITPREPRLRGTDHIEGPVSESRDVEKNCPDTPVKDEETTHPEPSPPPYSVFSSLQKWTVVFIVALTTLLPPLTASIFYPVITLLAKELDVSITDINLTITIYLVGTSSPARKIKKDKSCALDQETA